MTARRDGRRVRKGIDMHHEHVIAAMCEHVCVCGDDVTQGNNDDLILSCCLHYCNDKARDFVPKSPGTHDELCRLCLSDSTCFMLSCSFIFSIA